VISAKSYLAPAAAILAAVVLSAPAQASEPIETFSVTSSDTSVGGHPDFTTSFTLANPGNPEAARNVVFNGPQGLFGNPNAVTRCAAADFGLDACPSDTQVGLVTVSDDSGLLGTAPIFDLVPGVDQTALFAFIVPKLGIPINIPVAVRTGGDYGLRFTVSEITQETPLAASDLTFWGFPAAPEHDSQRFPKGSPGKPAGCPDKVDTSCLGASSLESSLPEIPLTDNPTICTGAPLKATLTVQTYQDPANATSAESNYPATTECEKEVFKPVLYASPTTSNSDSPSGLNVELSSPQFLTHAASPSEIRSAIVTLPEGFTVNPDAADGQSSCTDAEMGFGSEAQSGCPDQSKIGTFALHTVALSGPLIGAVYIGRPQPGNTYRLFMAADGFGVHAKLEAKVVPDPVTGRLQVLFTDLPQAPFDDLQLHLFASDRGLMATPTRCAVYGTSAQFFPWNDVLADQTSEQFFSIRSGPGGTSCPGLHRQFDPHLLAGTSVATAGAFSDFHLRLDRDDGDQFLGDLGFTMPPGFTANLRGIPYCPEAAIAAAAQRPGLDEQAAPSCPAASQIGTTNVAAGPGTHPFHAIGRVYLAGPLQGAPLSLAAITPALAGPYDYGTIVVRVALNVDPQTAQVTALSEPVPRIVGGIPIRMRSIQVNIERSDAAGNPNFTINPTNCSPLSVSSQGTGDEGTLAGFSSYFNAVNCYTLPFAPNMAIRQLGGRKGTRRGANPALSFDLTTRPGDANIKSIAVTLSTAFEIDANHLGNLCSEKELTATHCAGRQAIGEATTTTPLLDQPLSGKVYAVSGLGGLPRLAFLLDGQVHLLPRAESKSLKDGRLRTTVPVVPDAQIGHFHLTVFGGNHGYLSNTRDLCIHTPLVEVSYAAQNGRTLTQKVKTKVPCGAKGARHKRHGHRR
jgi:hypothetical protein